jgi:hypothetical protein
MYGQESESRPSVPLGIKLKGSLNVDAGYYNSGSGLLRTSPYNFGIGGNLGLSIGRWNVPVTLVYRDHSLSLTRPFIHFGLSPNYKNVRFHLGNRNMFFSNYTLGGATFTGIGAETNLGKFRLGAMYGSFQNPFAKRDSIVFGVIELPTFERYGFSGKLGFGSDKNFMDIIVLKVKDKFDPQNPQHSEFAFKPKDNLVLGSVIRFEPFKNLSINLDGAVSMLTNDIGFELFPLEDKVINQLRSIIDINPTTNLSYAGDAEIRYVFKRWQTGIKYRRITPFFQSYGINYMLTDVEDITGRLSGSMLKNTLRFNATAGFQRNNLFNHKKFKSNRFVGSVMLMYAPRGPFRISANFNNYDISNTPTIVTVEDSLRVARIMNSIRVQPSYNFKRNGLNHQTSLTIMYRQMSGEFSRDNQNSENYYLSGAYGIVFDASKLNLRASADYNRNNNLRMATDRIGITLSGGKPILGDKVNLNISNSFFSNTVEGKSDGITIRTGLSASYRPFKSHSLNFSAFYVYRKSDLYRNVSDLQARLNYSLNF